MDSLHFQLKSGSWNLKEGSIALEPVCARVQILAFLCGETCIYNVTTKSNANFFFFMFANIFFLHFFWEGGINKSVFKQVIIKWQIFVLVCF